MPEPFTHRPVMVDEIVAVFATVPAGVMLDATLGGGGHSEALLESRPDLSILGVDRDPDALAAATARLERFGDRFRAVHARFDEIDRIMTTDQLPRPDLSGALFDLGVSSPQLDRAERGFSYRQDGPLDMRMDTTAPWSAADVVNGYDVDELARVIRRYGDERFAGRIARAIVAARPIETTVELATIVTAAIPAAARRTGGHPATRTFQAIRIEVNAELDALPAALDAAIEATAPGGRIAVLSYHSGEDRIVKERLRRATGACDCPPGLPCVCGAVQTVRLVRGVPKRPSAAEREANPRAASARLRVAERVDPAEPRDEALTMAALPVRRVDAPRPRASGVRRTPTPSTGVARRPVPRAQARVAVERGDPARRVVVVLMLAAVVLHTRLAERQLEIDRLEGARHRVAGALRRAPPAARRAALADPPGDRGRRAGHGPGAEHRVPGDRPGDAGPGGRRRRHRRRGHRHRVH